MLKTKSKAERQKWFNSLTEQEKEEFYNRRKTRKRKYQPNKYPEPIINAKNRQNWEDKILNKNPWMTEQQIPYEDYKHLKSITSKDYTKIA